MVLWFCVFVAIFLSYMDDPGNFNFPMNGLCGYIFCNFNLNYYFTPK